MTVLSFTQENIFLQNSSIIQAHHLSSASSSILIVFLALVLRIVYEIFSKNSFVQCSCFSKAMQRSRIFSYHANICCYFFAFLLHFSANRHCYRYVTKHVFARTLLQEAVSYTLLYKRGDLRLGLSDSGWDRECSCRIRAQPSQESRTVQEKRCYCYAWC